MRNAWLQVACAYCCPCSSTWIDQARSSSSASSTATDGREARPPGRRSRGCGNAGAACARVRLRSCRPGRAAARGASADGAGCGLETATERPQSSRFRGGLRLVVGELVGEQRERRTMRQASWRLVARSDSTAAVTAGRSWAGSSASAVASKARCPGACRARRPGARPSTEVEGEIATRVAARGEDEHARRRAPFSSPCARSSARSCTSQQRTTSNSLERGVEPGCSRAPRASARGPRAVTRLSLATADLQAALGALERPVALLHLWRCSAGRSPSRTAESRSPARTRRWLPGKTETVDVPDRSPGILRTGSADAGPRGRFLAAAAPALQLPRPVVRTGAVDFASVEEVNAAVQSACDAFPAPRETSLAKRAELFFRIRELLHAARGGGRVSSRASTEGLSSTWSARRTRGLEVAEHPLGTSPTLLKGSDTEQAFDRNRRLLDQAAGSAWVAGIDAAQPSRRWRPWRGCGRPRSPAATASC